MKERRRPRKIKAFVGVIGSGKDYQCKALERIGYKRISFADSVRDLAWHILNWKPKGEGDYEEFKNEMFSAAGYPSFTGREFLQRLGTGARDIIDEDIWVKTLIKNLSDDHDKFCISDMRFPNELRFISRLDPAEYDVEVIFTNYKSERYKADDNHKSEEMAQEFLKFGYQDLETIFRNQPRIGDTIRISNRASLSNKFIGQVTTIENINHEGYFGTDYVTSNGLTLSRKEFDIIKAAGIRENGLLYTKLWSAHC